MESNEDILSKKVGTIEKKSLEAKPVIVEKVEPRVVLGKEGSKNAGKEVGKKLVLHCKHPDKEEVIELSNIKFIVGESVKTSTTWINFDEEKNIQKGSTVALLMYKYQVETIQDLVGKTIDTEPDSSGYLAIKAY